jgi:hypothetical protein
LKTRLVVSTALLLVGSLAGCLDVSEDVVTSAVSPDSARDALVTEVNGGATTPFVYRVYVVPRGGQPTGKYQVASLNAAYRSDSALGVNLRWRGANDLRVEYLGSRYVTLVSNDRWKGLVVHLDSGVVDPLAPARHMLPLAH